jgi:hypothetical protein
LFLQLFVPLFDTFRIVKACLGVAGRNCFGHPGLELVECISLAIVEVRFCLVVGKGKLKVSSSADKFEIEMGPAWPPAEEPPIWAFNWKFLGSGNVGTVRKDFVPQYVQAGIFVLLRL